MLTWPMTSSRHKQIRPYLSRIADCVGLLFLQSSFRRSMMNESMADTAHVQKQAT